MFSNASVRSLLIGGFGLIIALVVVMAGVIFQRSAVIGGHVHEIVTDASPKAVAATEIRLNVLRNWANTLFLLQINDAAETQRITEQMTANSKVITERFELLDKLVASETGKQNLAKAVATRKEYTEARKRYLELVKSPSREEASQFLTATVRPKLDAYIDAISGLITHQSAKVATLNEENLALTGSLRNINLALSLIVIVLSIGTAILVTRSVTGALGGEVQYASAVARQIASGDLNTEVRTAPGDSTSLLASMKAMRDRLREVVGNINSSASQLGQAARELAQASNAVADASAKQSEATGATAAAVEEMTVGIGQIADSAKEAHAISCHSESLSRDGRGVIQNATAKMHNIASSVEGSAAIISSLEQQSNEISAVVNVIKDIADQTNLLALNAAIEAARAGEQGRGFAVVADEVRKLAERTTASTQEIAGTIAKIQGGTKDAVQSMVSGVDQVKSGTELAEQAGNSIVEIESQAQRVVQVVNDITSSLGEQSIASNEIARNVENIAAMVEENNAAAARAASAARQLEQLADSLSRTIGSFRM